MKKTILATIAAMVISSTVHAVPINNMTGLSSPQNVVTFEEIVLPTDTPVTSQYAGLGVTFSAGLYYDGDGPNTGDGWPNMSGHALGNFDGVTCPCTVPFSINFVSPVSGAAFAMVTTSGTTLLEAILNSTVIESFTATTGFFGGFFGFQGIIFDEMRVTRLNTVTTLVDNIQFNSTIPEPTTFAILGLGLAGLGAMRRRRVSKGLTL